MLRNQAAEMVIEMEKRGTTLEELAPLISGEREKELLQTGELEHELLICGQTVGLIHHIPTVKELIQAITREAEELN